MNILLVLAENPVNETINIPKHLIWAIVIAIAFSFLLAAIEIPSEAKKPFRSCIVPHFFLYCCLLIFGNVITTLLAAVLVVKLNQSLAPYFFIFAAFFGVFAFETILKNTNITLLDKGVLTIQDWITKARTMAAAAAIQRDIERTDINRGRLATRLAKLPSEKLNTFVMIKLAPSSGANIVSQLDTAAKASNADPKLYMAYALVVAVSQSEILAFLKET
jgi:hypothetical protein